MSMLKKYIKTEAVKAVRITKANCRRLAETIDAGDGCLTANGDPEEFIGDWLVVEQMGNSVVLDSYFRDHYKRVDQ
jgi:hypothetical protein